VNLKVPKSDIKIPKKIKASRSIKSFFGFIACFLGSFFTVAAPFSLWNLFFLIVIYRGYEYLERQGNSGIALFLLIFGFLLGLLTYF
tara:strand:- start:664 stop:924 length:261 start_codon:yes stop_codon:yes gene_type:complete